MAMTTAGAPQLNFFSCACACACDRISSVHAHKQEPPLQSRPSSVSHEARETSCSFQGWNSVSRRRSCDRRTLSRARWRGECWNSEGGERWQQRQRRLATTRAAGQDGVDLEEGGGAVGRVGVDPRVWITLMEAELERGDDVKAVSVAHNLRAFGKANRVPQKVYTLEDLRLNKIDASKFLSPVDNTLGSVRRGLQLALLAGGIVTWKVLDLSPMQTLGAVVLFLFIGTVDQVLYGGGGEALLLDTLGRQLSRDYKNRVAQHEAGHFLISYLMGILPKAYTLSSLDTFKRYNTLNVQAGTTFVDYEFQEEVAKGTVSAGTLDKVSCIALAGVSTEYVLYGVAEGGLADIQQLDSLLKGLGFTQKKADGQVRWAVLNTVTLLRRHKVVHSKLTDAMSLGNSVAQCIGVIESELANVAYI